MPRQLPWKVEPRATTGLGPKKTPSRSQSVASPAPLSRWSTPRVKSETELGRKARLGRGKLGRSPSTSPAPEPLEEELMHPGLSHDDRYRMVEDEFLFIAGIFTRHLHAAEYQRLKTLAAACSQQQQQQQADPNTLPLDPGTGIPRPITGEMTELVKRRNAALDTAARARQQEGIARSLRNHGRSNDGEERAGLTRGESSLQGLMESPRRQKVPLTALVGGSRPGSSRAGSRPGTGSGYRGTVNESPPRRRPGSGYAGRGVKREVERERERERVTESEEDEDDGDLDGQPVWPRKPDSRQAPIRRTTDPATAKRREEERENPLKRVKTAPLPTLARESPVKTQAAVRKGGDHENEDHKDEDEDKDEDFFTRLRARRAEQKRRREVKATMDKDNIKTENAQAASLNSIPFM